MRLFDFHCHVDLYKQPRQIVVECERLEIRTLAVTTTPRAWEGNQKLVADSRFVRVGLGLHPQLCATEAKHLDLFEELLPRARYVGEIGIDAGRDHRATLGEQERVFARILNLCSEAGGKVLSIHSKAAAGRVLESLERSSVADGNKVILHWFTGTVAQSRRGADLGCYFSVNSRMTKTAGGRALLKALPRDRVLTETDGPFVETDGQPDAPPDVRCTLDEISEIWGCPTALVGQTIEANARSLLEAPPRGDGAHSRDQPDGDG